MKKINAESPLVVIFGRTNVGKSSLFNRLTETNKALVSEIAGTTRDGNIGRVFWRGVEFELIDTGGIMDFKHLFGKKIKTADIETEVQQRARDYLKRADLILFLVDSQTGLLEEDRRLAIMTKRIVPQKKIILVANKADGPSQKREIPELHKLSLGEPIPVSAITGSGTGDLLDLVLDNLKKIKKAPERKEEKTINVSILGKPNVGKSSLLNSILGEERVIVSPIPHTTREPQDTVLEFQNNLIKIVDTAGISKKELRKAKLKKAKVSMEEKLIEAGILKSLGSLQRADIAILVLDIKEGITNQDQKIAQEIVNRKKSLVIVANKWDLIEKKDTKKYTSYVLDNFPFARWAEIQFTSALTGTKVNKILELILKMEAERKKELTDSQLNSFMMRTVKIHPPAKGKGLKRPRIHKFAQTKTNPPEFDLRIGSKDELHFSYVRFIENRLREKFGFKGAPLIIHIVKGKNVHGMHA